MLFLLAAGLTLVLGIMNVVNLAHGSLYMIGAYFAITVAQWSGSYLLGVAAGLVGTLLVGMVTEVVALRTLYDRDHLDQVLATFGLILFSTSSSPSCLGASPCSRPCPLTCRGTSSSSAT